MNTDNTDHTGEFGTGRAWVLFDAECSLCVAAVRSFGRLLRRHRLEPRPLQTPGLTGRLGIAQDDLLKEMRLVDETGRVSGGAEALAQMARRIWWAWPLFALSRLPGLGRALALGYRWIAQRRSCAAGVCPRLRTPAVAPRPARAGWVPLIVLPCVALAFKGALPAWGFMWALALAIFLGCKWLTWWTAPNRGRAHTGHALAYLLAWPGMDAETFLKPGVHSPARPGRTRDSAEWYFAVLKTLVGAGLIWGLARLVPKNLPLLPGWVGLAGCAFVLHFGVFHLLALAWQRFGINAEPIMRAPILAVSMGEFWGKRWNAAFHRLAHEYAFQPLRRVVGSRRATLGVFLLSGLVHEAVISLPAGGGYGLPTAYFAVQGCALLFERSTAGQWLGLGRGLRGWFFTVVCVAAPAFALFHPPFINAIALPFLRALGAF